MKKYVFLVYILFLSTQISIAQNLDYKVYAVKFATSGYPFMVADWVAGGPKTQPLKIDFMVWLIIGNGKNILVDAGFWKDMEDAKEFKLNSYQRPDSALMKLNIKAEDITDVILSHPHWDHVDGIGLFPNAQVWMQKEDYNYFVGGAWQKNANKGGYTPSNVRQIVDLNLAGKLTLIDGDNKEIIPGIKVFTGSRHTYNSQYVLVQAGKNKIVLASDNIWVYYSLEHLLPAAAGGTLDPAGYVKAMQRMKTLVSDQKFIIPGHDAAIFERFPEVADGVVEIK
jgi:glyoxylase-like metal-dependent hydrolase (beta-lactamase superfamily II)